MTLLFQSAKRKKGGTLVNFKNTDGPSTDGTKYEPINQPCSVEQSTAKHGQAKYSIEFKKTLEISQAVMKQCLHVLLDYVG